MKKTISGLLFLFATSLMAETIYVGTLKNNTIGVVEVYSDSVKECSDAIFSLNDDLSRDGKIVTSNKCVSVPKPHLSFGVPR